MSILGAMQDWELRVSLLIDHAAREHGAREIVTQWADGSQTRATWASVPITPVANPAAAEIAMSAAASAIAAAVAPCGVASEASKDCMAGTMARATVAPICMPARPI